MTRYAKPARVEGALAAPASKSSMQRAVACALLAEGRSTLRSPSLCADGLAALEVARALGARAEAAGPGSAEELRIEGAPDAVLGSGSPLDLPCGESGLCMRLFAAVAALRPGQTRLLASGSLARRPMAMAAGPLEALGARCAVPGGLPPMEVSGPLRGGRAVVDARGSSQFLTGLLLALPLAPEDSLVEVAGIASGGYVDLTLDTMCAFGVEVGRREGASGPIFEIEGRRRYRAADFAVEGDWSGAAFLLVAAATAGGPRGLAVSGLRADSSQPDRAVLEALKAAGAELSFEGPVLRAAPPGSGGLRAFRFDARDRPDLFPPLVALAARCAGRTELVGVSRLRDKESDRAAALSEEFGKLGIEVRIEGDSMLVTGGEARPARVDARGDHRVAMAAAAAALAAAGPVEIDGAECVAKSWPSFFEDLAAVSRPR